VAGATKYLVKPIKRADLEAAIQAVCGPFKRVLIVDDDPEVQQLLARMLRVEDATVEVATAQDAEQGLSALQSSLPGLVLLDIVMPRMDGWQFLEQKSRDAMLRDIPVILISAQDPVRQPVTSNAMIATVSTGLSPHQVLNCALKFSTLLVQPAQGPV
jgi:CheY-like chemotaxis protein